MGPHRPRARSIADRFFRWAHIRHPRAHFAYTPSRIFTQFCKGITYFADEPIQELYHRTDSCGASDRDYLDKFAMVAGEPQDERMRKHLALRKCYLERSIFNQIYRNVRYQDVNHLLGLRYIERLLESYAPKENLVPTLEGFELGLCPTVLRITNRIKGLQISIDLTETYTHPRGSDTVACRKVVIKQNGSHQIIELYEKTQGFDGERPWDAVQREGALFVSGGR